MFLQFGVQKVGKTEIFVQFMQKICILEELCENIQNLSLARRRLVMGNG